MKRRNLSAAWGAGLLARYHAASLNVRIQTMPTILVTGGAGYIGSSHLCRTLAAGYEVVVVDNFSNSKPRPCAASRDRRRKLAAFYRADIRDKAALARSSRPTPSTR